MPGSATSELQKISPTLLEEARRRTAEVKERIAESAARVDRAPEEITLVGVAKRQPTERILAAIAAGLRVIGQSYVQEAREVRPKIESALARDPSTSQIRLDWRMVGRLQRNKAGLAARLFDAVETLDRPELATSLSRRAQVEGHTLDVLIQVSLCGEPQKGGCEEDALLPLARQILELDGLRLRGLMTIPSASPDPESARPAFRRLRELRQRLADLDPALAHAELSMGMSGDLEIAVEEGATLVRVGTALFGERIDPASKRSSRG